MKLIEEFQDQVLKQWLDTKKGQQHSKITTVTAEDLAAMYSRYTKGEVTLCDGCSLGTGQESSDGEW